MLPRAILNRQYFRRPYWPPACCLLHDPPFLHSPVALSRCLSCVFTHVDDVSQRNKQPLYGNIHLSRYFMVPPTVGIIRGHWRSFQSGTIRYEKESSKVETAVKAMKDGEAVAATALSAPKRPLWKRIWDEIVHYYHGFRLLFIDIKVSWRLALKVLRGQDMSRREHKQLVRTVSDLFRLLPFSVFIIVPFMELLLPVALKLFPGMLPSTFQTVTDKEDKIKKQFKVKLEMAKFLQDTLDEMAVHRKGEKHSHNAKEFALFFEKVRTTGYQTNNEEILKFSKLFEDELTLDSLSRPQLTALCRLLELQPLGTNNFLQFQLKMKLRNLKADDQMINNEGVDSLTVPELQAACRSRGMRALGVPEDRLRYQLIQWLELSLNEHIPPSLLLLSRALYLPEHLPATDQLKATLSVLPEAATTEAKYKIGEQEGKVDNKTKLELIRQEEEAIRKEREEQVLEEQREALLTPDLDKAAARDALLDTAPTLTDQATEMRKTPEREEESQLSKEDFEELEDALDQIAKEKKMLLVEEEELDDLKEEMQDYKEDLEEFKAVVLQTGDNKVHETKAASHLYNRVNSMISKMDKLREELSQEKSSLQQTIEDKAKEGLSIQKEKDNIININDLVLAIRRIQKSSDDTRLQRIEDVLDKMDVDHDGAVEVDEVLKVIELLGRENVKVSTNQMNEIIDLLAKEETLENQERLERQREKLMKQPEFQNSPVQQKTEK